MSKLSLHGYRCSVAVLMVLCLGSLARGQVQLKVAPRVLQLQAQDQEQAAPEEPADPKLIPTHKQVGTLKVVGDDGQSPARIRTFCLDGQGRLLVACNASGQASEACVRVLNEQGEQTAKWPLAFEPETLNVDEKGNVYVAGSGKIVKFDADGNTLAEAPMPQLAAIQENMDAFREKVTADMKATREMLGKQIERFETLIAELEKKNPEELSDVEKSQLNSAKQMIEYYRAQQKRYEEITPEQIEQRVQQTLASMGRANSIASTGDDVFLACANVGSSGYAVWRLDAELENPTQIVEGLRGCCGNMDVQARDGVLCVAENSRFRIGLYDREGKEIVQFGSRERQGDAGFASCCNPMTARLAPDGTVYTGEATVGRIKHFSKEGEFLGTIGEAELVPGCKHVAIAIVPGGGRVYMLDLTRNYIIVMEQ